MPMVSASFKTKKEATAFGKRAFKNPKVVKRGNKWIVYNER